MAFRIEALSGNHDRSRFESGSAALDRYLREQASQDMKRRLTTCFVAVDIGSNDIAGFYTLSAAGVVLTGLPPEITGKRPRYPLVPAALMGRHAVAQAYQPTGLGGVLLANAVLRTARTELGVFAMLVDAKDEAARRFYEHHGFALLPGEVRRLCLPIATALQLFESGPGTKQG